MLRVMLFLSVVLAANAKFNFRPHDVRPQHVHHMQIPQRLEQFTYENCNTSAVPIFVKNLAVTPDPLVPGSMMTANADVALSEDIDGKIDYNLDIEIKVGDEFMSVCNYLPSQICSGNDVCAMLGSLTIPCPAAVTQQGSNCRCPFKQKTYDFKNIQYTIPSIPGGVDGTFHISAKLTQNQAQIMCLKISLCINQCT